MNTTINKVRLGAQEEQATPTTLVVPVEKAGA